MKKPDDEQMQQLAASDDAGMQLLSAAEQAAVNAYRVLVNNLEKEPAGGLPYQFAVKTTALLRKRLYRKKDVRFYLFSLVMFCVALLAAWGLLCVVSVTTANTFLQMLMKLKYVIAFGLCMFLVIQFADQKAVKKV